MKEMRIALAHHNTPAYWQMVALRRKILRTPLGLDFTAEELAAEADAYHVGAWCGEELIGCLVLEPLEEDTTKLRQVAVQEDWQRQGVGTALVHFAEALARQQGYRKIVLHAREAAVPFYLRLHYRLEGEPFVEVNIPHRLMVKEI